MHLQDVHATDSISKLGGCGNQMLSGLSII